MICILNTGGTFNKRYDPVAGVLAVPADNRVLSGLIDSLEPESVRIEGLIFKDSLEMDEQDRRLLVDAVRNVPESDVIVVHGTDTMHLSARQIACGVTDKRVILTGAMVPVTIDAKEACLNLGVAIGALRAGLKSGVYVSMHGLLLPHDQLVKDRKIGKFIKHKEHR